MTKKVWKLTKCDSLNILCYLQPHFLHAFQTPDTCKNAHGHIYTVATCMHMGSHACVNSDVCVLSHVRSVRHATHSVKVTQQVTLQ